MWVIVIISILIILILLLLWVLFIPLEIYADTDLKHYEIKQMATFSIRLFPFESTWVKAKVMGIRVNTEHKKPKKAKSVKNKKRDSTDRSYREWLLFVKRSLKSIKTKMLAIDIDTGDVVRNAHLYPIAYCVNNIDRSIKVNVNFSGRVYGHLEAEVRLHNILWAFIKLIIKK